MIKRFKSKILCNQLNRIEWRIQFSTQKKKKSEKEKREGNWKITIYRLYLICPRDNSTQSPNLCVREFACVCSTAKPTTSKQKKKIILKVIKLCVYETIGLTSTATTISKEKKIADTFHHLNFVSAKHKETISSLPHITILVLDYCIFFWIQNYWVEP